MTTASCEVIVKDNEQPPIIPQTENPFTDVSEHEYYYAPVLWALDSKITVDLTVTQFGPEESCTRGQVVTFLYCALN